MRVPARGSNAAPVEVTVPEGWPGGRKRKAIAADVVAGGRYLGLIAEAVVDVRGRA